MKKMLQLENFAGNTAGAKGVEESGHDVDRVDDLEVLGSDASMTSMKTASIKRVVNRNSFNRLFQPNMHHKRLGNGQRADRKRARACASAYISLYLIISSNYIMIGHSMGCPQAIYNA